MNIAAVAHSADILAVAQYLLSDIKRHGAEYHAPDPTGAGSIKIHPAKQLWKNFAADIGGDAVALWAHVRRCSQGDAAKQLAEWAGTMPAASVTKAAPAPLRAVPYQGDPPDMTHWTLGAPERVHPYRDAQGRILHVVAIYRREDGSKEARPRTWDGQTWQWRGPSGDNPRPLYGLDRLAASPDAPVLLVEGERCAEVVPPPYVGVTWMGGAATAHRADVRPLLGRRVTVWPDNDDPGRRAARVIAAALAGIAASCAVLATDDKKPPKWDIADAVAEGVDIDEWILSRHERAGIQEPTLPAVPDVIEGFPDGIPNKLLPCTIENVAHILTVRGWDLRYNEMTHRAECESGTAYTADNADEAFYSRLLSDAARSRLATSHIRHHLTEIADRNSYHPVRDWVLSRPWDGRDRWADLMHTVRIRDAEHAPLAGLMMRRWFVSAARALEPSGVEAHGVLVFVGDQGSGKTRWFKRLCPIPNAVIDGLILDPADKDSQMIALGAWIAELGELDGSFGRAEIAQIKGFCTRRVDQLRKPYAATVSYMPRRTVFIASSNHERVLRDPTGNRRWWVVHVDGFDYEHTIDMQQVWAQVLTWDEPHWFEPAELPSLNAHVAAYAEPDAAQERIVDAYDWDAPTSARVHRMTATAVAESIGMSPDRGGARVVAVALQALGVRTTMEKGTKRYHMPPRAAAIDSTPRLA